MKLTLDRSTGRLTNSLGRTYTLSPVEVKQYLTIHHLQNREANLAHRLFNLLVEVHLLRAGFCRGKPKPMEFRATRGPGLGARKVQA